MKKTLERQKEEEVYTRSHKTGGSIDLRRIDPSGALQENILTLIEFAMGKRLKSLEKELEEL